MIDKVNTLPEGATWRKCALQVNPFRYREAFNLPNRRDLDEETYDKTLIEALVSENIDVIAITDHWCVDTGMSLRKAATEAGITVYPGFEATAKDGVHLLVLFDPSSSEDSINRRIGECGIPSDCRDARVGKLDTSQLLEAAETWNAVIVAPHVNTGGGLLEKLSGESAIKAWKDDRLHAVALGGVSIDQKIAGITENKNADYHRNNRVAVLKAADISSPETAVRPGSSCWIKLSSPTITGLDLSFRTPETRVSLVDPAIGGHGRIVGITWEGGFLDGVAIRFNESLNVLIGGRGSGKSTVIESLRYALGIDPLAQTSIAESAGLVKNVLGAGTKISVHVQVRKPKHASFLVERTIGAEPTVTDSNGELLNSRPTDILAGAEFFGQRELAELARDRQKLTRLLAQYLPDGFGGSERRDELNLLLKRSRLGILENQADIVLLDTQLARVPIIQERVSQFEAAGAKEKLDAQQKIQQEQQLLARATTDIDGPIQVQNCRLEIAYLSDGATLDLPDRAILKRAESILLNYNIAVESTLAVLSEARSAAQSSIASVVADWDLATKATRAALDKVLRELQPDGVDGNEYLKLRSELSGLEPKQVAWLAKHVEARGLISERAKLLASMEEHRASTLLQLQREAKKVERNLPKTVRASVRVGDDRSVLTSLLDKEIGGRLDLVRNAISGAVDFSALSFANLLRDGADAIVERFPNISVAQAASLAAASEKTLMLVEEIELPVSTDLELNVGSKDSPTWRSLDHLSTGQKATALLLLLMHRGDGPLVIDQPEDDLDNRFIYEDIVPRLRETKGKRQVVFSSHNANIPVLGDADQIVSLAAEDGPRGITGRIVTDGLGSIDHPPVRIMVEELLEGGRAAFNTRRYLYGF